MGRTRIFSLGAILSPISIPISIGARAPIEAVAIS
jgi:hypothetical protein